MIISIENQFLVFLREAVLHKFYCILSEHETVYALSDAGTELWCEIELQQFDLLEQSCVFFVFFFGGVGGVGGGGRGKRGLPEIAIITDQPTAPRGRDIIIEPRHVISNNVAIG